MICSFNPSGTAIFLNFAANRRIESAMVLQTIVSIPHRARRLPAPRQRRGLPRPPCPAGTTCRICFAWSLVILSFTMAFPLAAGQDVLQLGNAAGHAGLDRADRDVQDFGDFFVGTIFADKKARRAPDKFRPLAPAPASPAGNPIVDGGGERVGRSSGTSSSSIMRKSHLPPPALQKRPMQCRKQPGLHFRLVPQLMAFGRPHIKCLLRQIARIGLGARQAESKLIERLVISSPPRFQNQA